MFASVAFLKHGTDPSKSGDSLHYESCLLFASTEPPHLFNLSKQ